MLQLFSLPREGEAILSSKTKKQQKSSDESADRGQAFPFRVVAYTSTIRYTNIVLLLTIQIQRLDQRLQQLI